jgi:hypothetical protein
MEKRWILTECKRCGVHWRDHGKSRGGLKAHNSCVANAFMDFKRVPVLDSHENTFGDGI